MRRVMFLVLAAGLAGAAAVPAVADGLLVPTDRSLEPLSLEYQRVRVTIEGQVATTTVEQVFRNPTDRELEADYLFPLPPGASVREFVMWVDGKRLSGETIEADKARKTYEDIVRRLKDPGLLEYVDRDLWKVRVFPIPRRGEQKIEITFTTLLKREGDVVGYHYPLRTGQTPRRTSGDFTLAVDLKGPDPIGPIYSPTHDVAIDRKSDHHALVSFEKTGYTLDKDFALYYAPRAKDVGLSLLTRGESGGEPGYFLLLLSPGAEKSDAKTIARDLVLVLDTSGSMSAEKLRQAKGALKFALDALGDDDRFALIQFATVVTPFRDTLLPASAENLAAAREWVEGLSAQGGTNIDEALAEALRLRPQAGDDRTRTFQVVFFTDGLPTIGETRPEAILQAVQQRNTDGTRIFTFGVGDDVDTRLLDQLAEVTRASSTYVRPSEDLEVKASALVAKISHPVRTDLRLKADGPVRLVEMYPPKLPDLFRGEQLQVVGRFEGEGSATLTLESRLGDRDRSETFPVSFTTQRGEHDFLPPLWARRKIGYLLDQIRLNGESAELRDEIIRLAQRFGIATPYTSQLIVPDEVPRPLALRESRGGMGLGGMGSMRAHAADRRNLQDVPQRARLEELDVSLARGAASQRQGGDPGVAAATPAQQGSFDRDETRAERLSLADPASSARSGAVAVELAQRLAEMKSGARTDDAPPLVREVAGARFRKVEDAWIDDRFDPKAPTLQIQTLGTSYFRLLDRYPEIKDILALGDRVVWVSPSGTALIVDHDGSDDVPDEAIDALFTRSDGR